MIYIQSEAGKFISLSDARHALLSAVPELYSADDGVPETMLGQPRRPVFYEATDPLVLAFLAAQPTAKSLVWTRIKTERDRRKAGGFKVGSLWYHSDEASRGQYSILLSMAVEKSIPVGTALSPAWKDMAGNFAPMTVALLRQIRDAGLALEQQLFTTAETHRMAMEASADPASYDFSTGWPAAYTA